MEHKYSAHSLSLSQCVSALCGRHDYPLAALTIKTPLPHYVCQTALGSDLSVRDCGRILRLPIRYGRIATIHLFPILTK